MSIKRKTVRKQSDDEKRLAKELTPFYEYLNTEPLQAVFVPFRKCSAAYGIVGYKARNWLVLHSYQTIVSAYLLGSTMIVHFGRYSATTYQHQAKFEEFIKEDYLHYFKPLQTYWLDYEDWYN